MSLANRLKYLFTGKLPQEAVVLTPKGPVRMTFRGGYAAKVAEKVREAPVEPPELLKDREQLGYVRRRRWAALQQNRAEIDPPRDEVRDWAIQMTARYGPHVQVWENKLDWVTALYVVRYGENEAYWPRQFADGDVFRARQWRDDPTKTPEGVTYLIAKEG